jgi:HEAT repeat protein
MHSVESLKSTHDLVGLIAILRDARSQANRRASAAAALGELGDLEAVESLIRASLEDPDTSVQMAARQALEELIAGQAELAISAYQYKDPDDPWLIEADKPIGKNDVPQFFLTDESEFHGLISILKGDPSPEKRSKALHLLKHSTDARVVEWLLRVCLYEEDPQVQRAAQDVLEEIFPNKSEEMLENYRSSEPQWELEGEKHEKSLIPIYNQRAEIMLKDQPPAVMEEKANWRILMVVAFVLIVILLVFLLFGR